MTPEPFGTVSNTVAKLKDTVENYLILVIKLN